MTDAAAVAAMLPGRLDAAALERLGGLLQDDARWGGDGADTDQTCRNRAEISAWLGRLLADGVEVDLTVVAVADDRLVVQLAVGWPGRPGVEDRYAVFTVRAGRISDIRPADSRADAHRRAGLAPEE